MTKEQYIKITEPLRSNPERANRVTSLNHVLTALVFCVYPLYLFMLFADKDPWLWRAILVPAVSFVGLSIVRKIIKRKSISKPARIFCFHYRNDDFLRASGSRGNARDHRFTSWHRARAGRSA